MMECVALKAAMVMPAVLLQQHQVQSKNKESTKGLEKDSSFGRMEKFQDLSVKVERFSCTLDCQKPCS